MKIVFKIIIIASVFILFANNSVNASNNNSIRRFAVIIGSNYGGREREELKYAVSDAVSIVKVLKELGGLPDNKIILLDNPNPQNILSAFNRVNRLIKKEKVNSRRVESVLYYSGHAGQKGIILKGGILSYEDLKKEIKRLSSDVKVAIIDSCSSGALVRLKGGERLKPFLFDHSNDLKGYAILSSSSDTEASQESDHIRASFFTHCLISGLRGAADANGDGKITLFEAYYYSFYETSYMTKSFKSAPQHPGYDIRMKGAGDLILTDIDKSSSSMKIVEDIRGEIYIYNESGGFVAELNNRNKEITLGLSPDNYYIKWNKNGTYYQANVELKEGQNFVLDEKNFSIISDDLSQESIFALQGITFTAQPLYSMIYGDFKDELEPSGGIQIIGNMILNNIIINPIAIIGYQFNTSDKFSMFYTSVGTALRVNPMDDLNLSLYFTIGSSTGKFKPDKKYTDKDKIEYSQPIIIPGLSVNYSINEQYFLSFAFQSKYFIDQKITFGTLDFMGGIGYRIL